MEPSKDNRNAITVVNIDDTVLDGKSIEDATLMCFPVGSVWKSNKDLLDVFQSFAMRRSFCISHRYSGLITCFQADTKGTPKKKKTLSASPQRAEVLKYSCGCTYSLKYTGIERKPALPNVKRRQYDYSKGVRITNVNAVHTCNISSQQFQASLQRSGALMNNLTAATMFNLCQMLQDRPNLDFRTIRALLRRCSPSSTTWSGKRICNLRRSIIKKMKNMPQELMHDYVAFTDQFKNDDFLTNVLMDESTENEMNALNNGWKELMGESDGGTG